MWNRTNASRDFDYSCFLTTDRLGSLTSGELGGFCFNAKRKSIIFTKASEARKQVTGQIPGHSELFSNVRL